MAILKHVHKPKDYQDRAGCTTAADVQRLIEYLLRESAHGGIVFNDFINTTAAGIADEILALDRGRTKYLANHFMFSFPKDEEARWQANLDALLRYFKQRFGIYKMVAADHRDKDHYHVHIAVFAQTESGHKLRLETHQDGHAIGVAQSLRRIAEEWEDRLGGRKTGRGAVRNLSLSKETLEAAERQYREGEAPTPIPRKLQLNADIERAVKMATSIESLTEQAAALNIEVRLKRDDQGNALGVSFSRDGISIRGRDAGFSLQRLQQIYGTSQTLAGRSPADRVAGPDRRSNYRQYSAVAGSPEPTPRGAKQTDPTPRGVAAHQRGTDRRVFGETKGLIDLLTRSSPTPPSILGFVAFVLAALTQDPPQRRRSPPRIPL